MPKMRDLGQEHDIAYRYTRFWIYAVCLHIWHRRQGEDCIDELRQAVVDVIEASIERGFLKPDAINTIDFPWDSILVRLKSYAN
jgi:hypothetical protein